MRRIISTAIVLLIAAFGIALTPAARASAKGTCAGTSLSLDRNFRDVTVPTTFNNSGNLDCQLGLGNAGPPVRALQTALKHCYVPGLVVDGFFGLPTRSALVTSQQREHITPNGVYGPVTAVHLLWWDGLPGSRGCSRLR
jgi:hypothetical protein